MNRTQLTAFAVVAETGGFTRGAERLMVSQPAISLQVASLEQSLGVQLFDRLPRGVRLTAAGELLQGYAQRIDALEREAENAVADLIGLGRGRLVIGASLTIGSYLLPGELGRFRRAYPNIEIALEIANTRQIERMLLDHQLDLAFTEGPVANETLAAEVIQEDRLVPIAPSDHPLAQRRKVTAAQFLAEPMIAREIGSGTREVVEQALRKRRLTFAPFLSLGSTEAIKRAVQGGLGVAIVSELAIESEIKAGTLAVVPIADFQMKRPLQLLRPPNRTDSPAAVAFLKVLRRERAPRGKSRGGNGSGSFSRVSTGAG